MAASDDLNNNNSFLRHQFTYNTHSNRTNNINNPRSSNVDTDTHHSRNGVRH